MEGRRFLPGSFYRPMEVLSYMFDYSLWGLNPLGTHCTSILLHLCNSLLLLVLLGKIGLAHPAAFLATLAFAVHPVNSESVTYSVRGDLLGALFSLLCFLSYLRFLSLAGARRLPWAAVSIGTFGLAVLSKESAVMLPFILIAYRVFFRHRYREGGSAGRGFWLTAALLCISLGYALFRVGSPGGPDARESLSLISDATLAQRWLTLPRILCTYLGLLILPRQLHMEYHFVEKGLAGLALWGVPLLVFAGGCAFFWRATPSAGLGRDLRRHFGFFLLWFLVGLVPFYNIVITLHATLAEHWAYFAGMGFLAFLAAAGGELFRRLKSRRAKAALALAAGCWFAYNALYTVWRNRDWSDPMRLYQHDLRHEPNSFVLHNNLGVMHIRAGDIDRAKECFLESIRVSPGGRYSTAHNNLGVVHQREGDPGAAEAAYKRSIELDQYALAYGNLSSLYLKQGKVTQGIEVALEGKRLHPMDPAISYWLAVGYFMDRRRLQAQEEFNALERIAPDYQDTRAFLREIDRALQPSNP